jgi:hypothetical protein
MTLLVEHEINCDTENCHSTYTTRNKRISETCNEAEEFGWIINDRDSHDYCPTCAKKMGDE